MGELPAAYEEMLKERGEHTARAIGTPQQRALPDSACTSCDERGGMGPVVVVKIMRV